VVDSGGRGMQVARVYPGSAAEQAGLQVGDVIHSANGYLTQEHGNLAWIIANTAPNGELRMNVRTARDGVDHLITARVP
jgi:serine protease Do